LGGAGPHLTQCRLGRGLPPYQVVSSCIQPFGHNRHGRKIGGLCPPPFLGGGELGPRQHKVGYAEAYLHTKWHLNLAVWHNRRGPKLGVCPPLFRGKTGFRSNTKSAGPWPTSIPSGILIHLAVWPQRTWAENWRGLCPFEGSCMGPHSKQCGPRPRPACQVRFYLDPSSRLATIHQRHRYRTDRQTGQRSDSIGRTVLQTVAQKTAVCTHTDNGDRSKTAKIMKKEILTAITSPECQCCCG